ncbi:S-layer homology domain-containing protein [Paenibacillus sp. 1_12]|uniref:S-layer homology domain-containing protein n=1 Tax=Paenibacillus sp. 1_12 TaxID=1566278 RepID=UPI0008E1758A|nr:S-layer homology domain-containing protein [Paenibacillus sp. 1_12]SFM17388.1 S-layer homology domain-containing protein [Paenibacillus sp. 1_12]
MNTKLLCSLALSGIIASNLLIGPVTAASNNLMLGDITGHWAENAIQKAVAAGYVNGYADGTFRPDASITEEEFLSMTVHALQIPFPSQKQGESWFAPVLDAANQYALYKGDYQNDWQSPIRHDDAAKTLFRATQSQYEKQNVTENLKRFQTWVPSKVDPNFSAEQLKTLRSLPEFNGQSNGSIDDILPDVPKLITALERYNRDVIQPKIKNPNRAKNTCSVEISECLVRDYTAKLKSILSEAADVTNVDYTDSRIVYEVVKRGLMQGDNRGDLAAGTSTTRAEAVALIERVLAYNSGKKLDVDKHALSKAEVAWHGTNIFTIWPRYFPEKFINDFDLSKAHWDSNDGNYHESGEQYIVVDMEDPEDPFLDEVRGMEFAFTQYDSNGNPSNTTNISAPAKSYVTYSKVRAVVDNDIDFGLSNAIGGTITSILIGTDKDTKSWNQVLSLAEDENTVLFTKTQSSQNTWDLNTANGNWSPSIPKSGQYILKAGTHYWVKGQVHPKGDAFIKQGENGNVSHSHSPDYDRSSHSGNNSISVARTRADYSVSN